LLYLIMGLCCDKPSNTRPQNSVEKMFNDLGLQLNPTYVF
jgi:hypothetical protein